ncbi:MAG: hypothetical protein ACTSWC_12030 [Promethearchaeota archaeon]
MLILTYFNPIIGPDILYSVPPDLEKLITEKDLGQIKRLMDTASPGFFTHAFSASLNTANYFFMIPSDWARGKQEMVMITKIIEEESPNLKAYAQRFQEFAQELKQNQKSIFKALYINNPPLNYEKEIFNEFRYLKIKFEELAKFFEISQVQTHGILLPFRKLAEDHAIHLPSQMVKELESFLGERENYFVVFQRRKDSFKVDILPHEGNQVVKFAVLFNGTLSPETLKQIGLVFQELGLPFVYTSGICQKGGQCIYEVYLNPKEMKDFEATKQQLLKIEQVDEVKIIDIELLLT